MWFEELVSDPATVIDPLAGVARTRPGEVPRRRTLSSENRTTGFKSKAFQSFALKANDRLERVLRRHPDFKRKLRAFYYKLNGKPAADDVPAAVRDELAERYREPNARLAAQLERAGIALPRVAVRSASIRRPRVDGLAARFAVARDSVSSGSSSRARNDECRRALEHEQHQRRNRDPRVVERVAEHGGERERDERVPDDGRPAQQLAGRSRRASTTGRRGAPAPIGISQTKPGGRERSEVLHRLAADHEEEAAEAVLA